MRLLRTIINLVPRYNQPFLCHTECPPKADVPRYGKGWLLGMTQKTPHLIIGTEGEDIAAEYLRSQHYKILDRNVRVGKHDEIDIIAFDRTERVMVFAEVKARAREDFDYRPELNITSEKRHRMSRAARRWIARKRYDGGYRLDVLCVAAGKVVDHFKEVAWG